MKINKLPKVYLLSVGERFMIEKGKKEGSFIIGVVKQQPQSCINHTILDLWSKSFLS